MTRPTNLKIGPFHYKVRWEKYVLDMVDGVEDETKELLSARADHFALEILVCSGLAPMVQRKSLLHEIIHACNWITGHDDATDEEQWTRSLAFPLLAVLRENPKLVAFLTE